MSVTPLPSPDSIRRLLTHRETFARPAEELWTETGGERLPDGSITVPSAAYAPEVLAFVRDLYDLGFIVRFDWSSWDEGRRLAQEPERIAAASIEECVKLLTAVVRSARFMWGEGYHLDSGIFRLVLERLQILIDL